ncbi:hypothetical protein IOCL2690_000261600 [Leishmania lindenbergi]|uniref:Uncharacterized protein n=1 Tax=Leishmania lindenbergi TaxID=651832 RepID=A0AAW3ANW1_9TRYP
MEETSPAATFSLFSLPDIATAASSTSTYASATELLNLGEVRRLHLGDYYLSIALSPPGAFPKNNQGPHHHHHHYRHYHAPLLITSHFERDAGSLAGAADVPTAPGPPTHASPTFC